MRGRPEGHGRLAVVGSLLLATVVLTGCAVTPAASLTVSDVIAERTAAREAVERERFDAFLGQFAPRFVELGLPLPEFQGVVSLDDRDSAVTECVVQLAPELDSGRLDGRVTVNYFGVVGEPYERTRWVLEGCIAQYGVADPATAPPPGAVEVAWRYQDATRRLLPCLRGIGVVVPTPPSEAAYARSVGTAGEWSPFALMAPDPAVLARALALCPPSSQLLAAATATAP